MRDEAGDDGSQNEVRGGGGTVRRNVPVGVVRKSSSASKAAW